MPYSKQITRDNPSCILFLIDQSSSMDGPFGGKGQQRKADGVAEAVNRLLQNLVIKCAKSEGIRDYFEVGVLGYGQSVGPAFTGALAGRELVSVSEVANAPSRLEDRTDKEQDDAGEWVEKTVKFPVWFEATAKGGTPMCQALTAAEHLLRTWVSRHPNAYPPIVINITDGESTDGDPSVPAQVLTDLHTTDGNILLFNCHISSQMEDPILFPAHETGLPDAHAQLLFAMSSVLPAGLIEAAQGEGLAVDKQARGFAFNADLVDLIRFLDIGTQLTNLR